MCFGVPCGAHDAPQGSDMPVYVGRGTPGSLIDRDFVGQNAVATA